MARGIKRNHSKKMTRKHDNNHSDHPSLTRTASTFAPAASKISTDLMWPFSAAMDSAVTPCAGKIKELDISGDGEGREDCRRGIRIGWFSTSSS